MKHILLIDDDQQFGELLKDKFAKEGFDVDIAKDGEAGLSILEKKDFDFLIIDMSMPKMDGVDFYYNVRNKLKKNIPSVILTNIESSPYQDDILEYIVKADISLDDLLKKIKKYLKISS